MAQPDNTNKTDSTTERYVHTETTREKSGGGMAVIVAAIILVLAALSYFVFLGDDGVPTSGDAGGGDVNISVEGSGAAAEGGDAPAADAPASADSAPAADSDTTAPAASE